MGGWRTQDILNGMDHLVYHHFPKFKLVIMPVTMPVTVAATCRSPGMSHFSCVRRHGQSASRSNTGGMTATRHACIGAGEKGRYRRQETRTSFLVGFMTKGLEAAAAGYLGLVFTLEQEWLGKEHHGHRDECDQEQQGLQRALAGDQLVLLCVVAPSQGGCTGDSF